MLVVHTVSDSYASVPLIAVSETIPSMISKLFSLTLELGFYFIINIMLIESLLVKQVSPIKALSIE